MTKINGLAGTRKDDADEWQEKGGMTEGAGRDKWARVEEGVG